MTEAHHDADLSKRLAIKFGIGERVHYREDDPDSGFYEDERGQEIDFCCNYTHGGMLEQKMAELGLTYWHQGKYAKFYTGFFKGQYDATRGANRLHATALAACWGVTDEQLEAGVVNEFYTPGEIQFRVMHQQVTGEWLDWDQVRSEKGKYLRASRRAAGKPRQ